MGLEGTTKYVRAGPGGTLIVYLLNDRSGASSWEIIELPQGLVLISLVRTMPQELSPKRKPRRMAMRRTFGL